MADLEALKPCPFCGGKARLEPIRDGKQVQCPEHGCFARGPVVYHGREGWAACERDAIAAWNRRAPDPRLEEAEKALEPFSSLYEQIIADHGTGWFNDEGQVMRAALAYPVANSAVVWRHFRLAHTAHKRLKGEPG